jgi:tRNA pseudouridine(38-40) synthase
MHLAILFAYNGTKFQGTSRSNGPDAIEALVLKALSQVLQVQMNNISRSSTTEPGEHANKQVLSVEILEDCAVPTPEQLNALLSKELRVFKVLSVSSGFSARKNCDARTFEYLIPSYVFTSPPEATHYCFAPLTEPDEDYVIELEPVGGLFNTQKRQSLSRRRTFRKSMNRGHAEHLEMTFADPTTKHMNNPDTKQVKRSILRKILDFFSRKKQTSGSEQLKAVLNDTLRRSPTDKSVNKETLKRSTSTKKEDVLQQDIFEREQEEQVEQLYEPLDIPAPLEATLDDLKAFRLSEKQFETIKKTLAMFSGTHNWHNYIPNAQQGDPRNFMRIINVDIAPLELHHGMEWLRIKMQAHVFAKFQIRRMMGTFTNQQC